MLVICIQAYIVQLHRYVGSLLRYVVQLHCYVGSFPRYVVQLHRYVGSLRQTTNPYSTLDIPSVKYLFSK